MVSLRGLASFLNIRSVAATGSNSSRNELEELISAGDCARDTKNWHAAAEGYRKALDIDPSMADIRLQYGHALKESGDQAGAEHEYRHAMRDGATDAEIQLKNLYIARGNGARDKANWADASVAYGKALDLDQSMTDIRVQSGHALKESGEWASAEKEYRLAIRHGLEDADIHLALAHLLILQNNFQGVAADQDRILELVGLLEPFSVKNAVKVRLGRAGDGGYVMLDRFKDIEAAFSFGIEREISWDIDMARHGCPIYMYDYSVDGPPSQNAQFSFFKKMIGAKQDMASGIESIDSVVAAHGAPGRKNILKIDIESAEWDAFDAVSISTLDRFSQIVCEFHDFQMASNPKWRERALRVLKKLNKQFAVTHVHGNNHAPYAIICNVPLPNVLEVSYAHRRELELSSGTEIFPTSLDFPNNKNRAEIALGSFRFSPHSKSLDTVNDMRPVPHHRP